MSGRDRKNADAALLAALAGGATVREAARTARVSERTLYGRRGDDSFRRQLAAARAEMIDRAIGTLARASSAAATTLARLLEADSESVRLGAARTVLELAVKLHESEEIEERLRCLEEQRDLGNVWKGARA